jgi:glycosyltransferase involved in cell wall biosynthesis
VIFKILINDYCGYPFQLDLSYELAKRGHDVCVTFTNASGGPKAFGDYADKNLNFINIVMPPVEKQNFFKRWFQEKKYGLEAIKIIDQFKPDIVISADTPLAPQRHIVNYCKKNDIKFVFWLQDIISLAVECILSKNFGIFGKLIGYIFKYIEIKALKKSDHIITITDDFGTTIEKWGIKTHNITVIPNWSSIEKIPLLSKVNEFSKKYGIDDKFVILYSGTMGMKHNPHIICEIANKLQDYTDIIFVVITDGIGMNILKEEKKALKSDNLLLLPFQPFEIFPQVLASANVLLTILEEDAGAFSVPSKVWSGYCAGRTSLLVIPENNLAAKRTKEINAGLVIPNDQTNQLSETILYLKGNPDLCNAYGQNARNFAEQHFRIDIIADRFETILNNLYE